MLFGKFLLSYFAVGGDEGYLCTDQTTEIVNLALYH